MRGRLVLYQPAPAAGAECVQAVPAGKRWELLSWKARFNTSATVANRNVGLQISDGASQLIESLSAIAQAASLAWRHYFTDWEFTEVNIGATVLHPFPRRLQLAAGWSLGTVTTNLQVGDQYIQVQILVEEWDV